MKRSAVFACCLIVTSFVGAGAQTPAPPTPNPSPAEVAGIPVNYDEAKVGTYTLPDPLKLNDGKAVRNAKTWWDKTPTRDCRDVRDATIRT